MGEMRLLLVRDVAASARFYRDAFGVEVHQGQEIAFEVDDLDQAHARAVAAGAEVIQPGVYRDPDGNVVTLTQRPQMARVAGVDIPIGIPDSPPRPADVAARRFVGPRASSVYPTPIRAVLEAPTYAEARAVALELTGKSVSAQSYALRHRILEVDEHARHDERVIEVHPEVSFSELASRPLLPKKRTDGQAERRVLLEDAGIELPASVPRIAEPDLLDATVAAWSARRYAAGEALPLPEGHEGRIGAIWR